MESQLSQRGWGSPAEMIPPMVLSSFRHTCSQSALVSLPIDRSRFVAPVRADSWTWCQHGASICLWELIMTLCLFLSSFALVSLNEFFNPVSTLSISIGHNRGARETLGRTE